MLARGLALVVLVVGAIFTAPSTAQADSRAYYSCTSSKSSALHMTATRIRYTVGGGTAIYASATQSYKQVLSLRPDIVWTFHHFESAGLQTRYSQPTQWGSQANQLPSTARWVDVYWHGVSAGGAGGYEALCRTTVGR